MSKLLLLVVVFLAGAAKAETLPPECKFLPEHVPSDDVAYKPGVDVHGKPVVPADLNDTAFEVPEVITVPLSIDLAEKLQTLSVPGFQLEAPLGLLEIHENGRVTYEGREWTPQ